jgi:hypothetical protein
MVSFALHVAAILIFGTIKFVSSVLREETVFEAAPIEPPLQKKPEYTVNIQQRDQLVPPPLPPAIVVNSPSELKIPTLDIDVDVVSSSVFTRASGGFGGGLQGMREMAMNVGLFGSQSAMSNSLAGSLYDLKQTAEGDPVPGMNNREYFEVLEQFQRSWSEAVLAKYYKADVELYTRQLFIPLVQASQAPKAFGAEKEIKPIHWVALYKGEWVSPFTGTMRFAGQGDNVLVVRLNRKVVLDATLGGALQSNRDTKWEPIGKTADPNNRPMVAGKWISVSRGQSYTMEVLLAEHGGLFSCYLLAQVKGQDYAMQSDGVNPRLPVFQLGPAKLPPYQEGKDAPEISNKPFSNYAK